MNRNLTHFGRILTVFGRFLKCVKWPLTCENGRIGRIGRFFRVPNIYFNIHTINPRNFKNHIADYIKKPSKPSNASKTAGQGPFLTFSYPSNIRQNRQISVQSARGGFAVFC